MAGFTQEALDALDEAIASGAQEVWYGKKKVTYRSLEEMQQIRAQMARAIVGRPRTRRRVARFHSGDC